MKTVVRRFQPKPRAKSESLMLRLIPRHKFALDLIARRRQQNMTRVIEYAIEKLIDSPSGDLVIRREPDGEPINIFQALWHEDEVVRFVRLAQMYPGLLRPAEEAAWDEINANPKRYFHMIEVDYPETGPTTSPGEIDIDKVRAHWHELTQRAR